MEIRLKIGELIIVVLGLLASGVLIGFILTGESTTFNLLYVGSFLVTTFTIIIRKRYKN
jgi:LPXTG-motif cell wall-anchored protein